MTGVSFTRGGYHRIGKRVTNGAGGYTVYRPDHWMFDGTGIDYGDVLGASATTVGYECDGCEYTVVDGLPEPTGTDGTPGLRDPRDVSHGPLHAHDGGAPAEAGRAVGDRVPRARACSTTGARPRSNASAPARRCSAATRHRAGAR